MSFFPPSFSVFFIPVWLQRCYAVVCFHCQCSIGVYYKQTQYDPINKPENLEMHVVCEAFLQVLCFQHVIFPFISWLSRWAGPQDTFPNLTSSTFAFYVVFLEVLHVWVCTWFDFSMMLFRTPRTALGSPSLFSVSSVWWGWWSCWAEEKESEPYSGHLSSHFRLAQLI